MGDTQKRRVVAIVGRPNVGKSSVFNRLAGRRIAIVHPESGITRDRLMQEVSWKGQRFELIDTGGLSGEGEARTRDEIEAGIKRQIDIALEDAAVALLVVDAANGVLPMDEVMADILRKRGECTVVAANKADTEPVDEQAAEFHRFGFPVYPVSALHNRGFAPLMDEVMKGLPPLDEREEGGSLNVAIVGRPNVGKSSYINRVLKDDRVIVSATPGTTRDSVDVPFRIDEGEHTRRYVLVDTAGMRRRSKVKSAVEKFSLIRTEESIRRANVVALLLDATQGPSAQDKKIASLVIKHGRGCAILVNKWDLIGKGEREYGAALLKALPFLSHCPILFVSTKSGHNIRRSIEAVDYVASQVRTSLPTAVLNRVLSDAYRKTRPPTVSGRRLKIFYAAQVGVEPLRIRVFVNDPARVRDAYRDYLVRSLREHFGLEGAPVVLQFRERRRQGRAVRA